MCCFPATAAAVGLCLQVAVNHLSESDKKWKEQVRSHI